MGNTWRALTFLILYAFFMTLILYSSGQQYGIIGQPDIGSIGEGAEIGEALINSGLFGWLINAFTIFDIPFKAFSTLTQIANQTPALAVFIIMPIIGCMLYLIIVMITIIRGGGGA